MKKLSFILLLLFFLTACEDKLNMTEPFESAIQNPSITEKGMQRAVFSSREELKRIMEEAEQISVSPFSRSLAIPINYSDNEDEFVSLIEANRREVMASLTPEQIQELENDEDELEFEPSDSVICDATFALLLNANRELQIADTIYKYYSNGVARIELNEYKNLVLVEDDIKNLKVTEENEGKSVSLASGIEFIPSHYSKFDPNDNLAIGGIGGNGGTQKPNTCESTNSGIKLSNGYTIPLSDIRDIDFDDGGDGNWIHKTLPKITKGFNVNSINKFKDGKKLVLSLHHYNYIVYSKIEVKLKFQKKKFLIWWNVNADEMCLGWETVCIKEEFALNANHTFPTKYDAIPTTEHYAFNPLPDGGNEFLLHIPFINYDFTNRDINNIFNKSLKFAVNHATNSLKELINEPNTPKRKGLFTTKDRDLYTLVSPHSFGAFNKKSISYTFSDKWMSNDIEIGIASDGQKAKPVFRIKIDDHLDVYYGQVFGAVRHKGKWLAGRITKVQKTKN